MKFLTFGEIMLRLKAPGQECFFQSPMLEATFGGGEANVAVSLANYGEDAAFLTVLPDNAIADACKAELRRFNVDTKRIVTGEGRMGIYYLEGGANQRPSKVVYDRAWSAIALAKPGDIDWDKAFEGVEWFHITGITPAISESAMELSVASVKEAKKRGITDETVVRLVAVTDEYGVLHLATHFAEWAESGAFVDFRTDFHFRVVASRKRATNAGALHNLHIFADVDRAFFRVEESAVDARTLFKENLAGIANHCCCVGDRLRLATLGDECEIVANRLAVEFEYVV